ncbi:MAG: sulfatase-like hydrolase/transferase, partial [Verrucomicrobiota bacterium]
AGYETAFFGKWHLGKEESDFPHGRGYDTNIGGCHAGAVGSHFFPYHLDSRSGEVGKEGGILGLEEGESGENVTDRLTSEAAQWIRHQRTADPGTPFFAFLSHFAVHTPIQGKVEHLAHYREKVSSLPPAEGEGGFLQVDGSCKSRRDHPDYASMVQSTDESLGRMLDLLEELEIRNSTIILFTSDHGGLSNRGLASNREVATSNLPYRAGKGHLYEGGLRVPFVLAAPGTCAPGSRSDEWAIGTDIFPTLLDLAGLELRTEHHVDGVSLVPALKGQSLERDSFVWHHPRPRPTQTGDKACSILREGKWKLVKSYFPSEGFELYDLREDPYEKIDMAEEKRSRVKRMNEVLVNKLVAAGAPDLRQDWKIREVTAPVAQ